MAKPPVTKPRSFPRLARKDGSWGWDPERRKVTLRHVIEGKQWMERADTVAQALTARNDRRVALQAQAEVEATLPRGESTIAQLWAAWLEFYAKDKAPKTKEGYDYTLSLIAPHLTCRVMDIDVEALENCLVAIVPHHTVETIRKIRGHLNMVLNYGVRHKYLTTNPLRSTQTPSGCKEATPPRWLNEDEFARMRAYLTANHSTGNTALLLILLCGLRPGEALGLRWNVIDFTAGTITVRSAVQRYAQGRKEQVVDQLKTATSYRTVMMPLDLSAALQREQRAQARREISDLVFTNVRLKNKPFSTNALEWAMKEACRKIGLEQLPPNSLRHTNASMLLHRGMAITDVARHLGHKNTMMVVKTYGHSMVEIVDTRAALAL